jgi:molybdopterin/thiamine biosynthesis adenylyltransferase
MRDTQLLRYARHIQLAEIDIDGQAAFMAAHVLIIGAGGLGSPAAMYLAASGVGQLTLVDDDLVELSNLQRQIMHSTAALGTNKAASGARTLNQLNPEVTVNSVAQRADDALLNQLVSNADVVLDCTDNFATRHLINRACVRVKKPLVSGAAIRFEGQISVYDARNTSAPCYACLFPEGANFVNEPCASLGVFAPLVGVIGAMQASEALKIIGGFGQPLVGKLLTFDARTMVWQTYALSQRPDCSVCGKAV